MTPHPLTCPHRWQDVPQLVVSEQGIYHVEAVCSICGVTLAEWRWFESEMDNRLTTMAWEQMLR